MTIYKCNECNFETYHKGHFNRHIKTQKHLDNTNKILKLEKIISNLEKRIEELEKRELVNVNNKSNNTNTTTNSYNTNTTNNTFNITINPYRETDYSCLTREDMIEAMSKKDYYLSHVFKKVHIDNPQNRNLYVRTKKAKEIFLYRGENNWEAIDAGEVLYGITMRCENACDEALEKTGLMEEYDSLINDYVDKREENEDYKKKSIQNSRISYLSIFPSIKTINFGLPSKSGLK